tara:strand:- start:3884 stop:5047 length:1164 start_codon:yes stop_codon:yes gene_type:complete
MKKQVLLRAPLLTYSGYGTHSRQIFRWLLTRPDIDVYCQLVPWGITPWMINPDFEGGLVGEIMKRSNDLTNHKFDVSLQVQLPNEWDPNLATVNIGISAVVETDRCNPQWVMNCNNMQHVIVPSTFTKNVLLNSGHCTTPITVVPECFYDEIVEENIPESNLDFETDFNFLLFGQFTGHSPETDRKNLFNTLRLMCHIFKDDPNVGIVLKTNSGRNTTIDKSITEKTVRQVISEVRIGEYPKVHLLHGRYSSSEIASLHRHPKIKCLVSLTRGEGFGLPLLEAAASGLPIIATNWSGHLDFLNLGKFIPVSYRLENIPQSRTDNQIFMQGSSWAEFDEANAISRLQKFRKSPYMPQKWAQELREKLLKTHTQNAINAKYNEALGRYM